MTKGAYLHVKDGLFEVLTPQPPDGTTHASYQYAVSHVETIWVHALASISTAAITLYKRMVKAGERISQVFQARTLSLYRQHLQGKINFVGFVRGKGNDVYKQLWKNMRVVVTM